METCTSLSVLIALLILWVLIKRTIFSKKFACSFMIIAIFFGQYWMMKKIIIYLPPFVDDFTMFQI